MYNAIDRTHGTISPNVNSALDLAVANIGSSNISILLNDCSGTFAEQVTYGAGMSPSSVAMADLDGDLDLDVVSANNASNDISVLLNNGDGTFATGVSYPVGNCTGSIAISDLDGDFDSDLAVAVTFSHSISVLFNNGAGTFAPAVAYAVCEIPFSVGLEIWTVIGTWTWPLRVSHPTVARFC